MVFRFPQTGIEVSSLGPGDEKALFAITKDLNPSFSHDNWQGVIPLPPLGMYREPLQQVLNLLLVNRQIFQEAFSTLLARKCLLLRECLLSW